MMDSGQDKMMFLLKGEFSRCMFQPSCCSTPCVSITCEVTGVKAVMAKKFSLIFPDLVDHVNVYASNNVKTGANSQV